MGESTILRIVVNQEEIMLLEAAMRLEKTAGQHTKAILSGLLDPKKEGQEYSIVPEAEIEVFDNGMEVLLSSGIIRTVEIGVETADADPLKRVELEMVSGTWLLDRKKQNRAFQDTSMSYQAVAEIILKNYKGASLIMKQGLDFIPVGRLMIQYQETDWMFLKRLMSRLNQPVIPDNTSGKPQMYTGIVGRDEIYEIPVEEESHVQEYYYIEQGDENGHLEYTWVTEKGGLSPKGAGDAVIYKGVTYYIKEAELFVENSVIRHKYRFCLQNGFHINEMHNSHMTGLSLPGAVEKVSGDQVQVKLDIDAVGGRNCWYTYSTFYSTFYCMPEIGDRVHLYIPGMREEQAFVLNSIRDKVSGGETGAGSFHGGSAVTASDSKKKKSGNTGGDGTNVLSWLNQMSKMPYGTIVGVGVETSEAAEEMQNPDGDSMQSSRAGTAAPASYSGNGTQSQAPEFDFQNLYNNEEVKVLSTRDNKMIILDDRNGSVSIRYSNGTFIVLKGDGIQIHSAGYLHLRASGNISLTANGSMSIKAEEQITLGCEESEFLLTPDGIAIHGTDIKINE